VNREDFAGLFNVQYPEELIEMQIEIFDPHTGGWKDQSKATEGRT